MSARKKKKAMSDEELLKILGEMPPPTWDQIQALRKVSRSQTRQDALVQILRAMPEGSESSGTSPSWQAGALLGTFLPNDGPESALARLMIAAMNSAMDCFARANSDAPEVRYLELNYAAKLSLVTAALSKAFGQHRGASMGMSPGAISASRIAIPAIRAIPRSAFPRPRPARARG